MDNNECADKLKELCNYLKGHNAAGVNRAFLAQFIKHAAKVPLEVFVHEFRELCLSSQGLSEQIEKCALAWKEDDNAAKLHLERLDFLAKAAFLSRTFNEERMLAVLSALERNPIANQEDDYEKINHSASSINNDFSTPGSHSGNS